MHKLTLQAAYYALDLGRQQSSTLAYTPVYHSIKLVSVSIAVIALGKEKKA